MNQSNKGADGSARAMSDDVARSAFVSVATGPPHCHQPASATPGITASHLAAMAATSNNYAPVDHNAAFMMSNAAATIAAVAASAVQQMTQAKAQPGTTATSTPGGPATLPASLFHAALQQHSNRNPLISGATSAPPVPAVPHAALLTALANAGQTAAVPTIATSSSAPGHADAATANSLLRPNAPVLSQPTTTLTSPALLSDMQSWSLEQLGMSMKMQIH